MPASGKSTIGVLLAKRLGYSFVDVDIVIQEETGKLLKEIIEEQGTVVYLKLDYSELEQRLGDLKDRGVALKNGMTLMDLYQERVPLYEKYADITVDEGHRGPGPVVDELRALMEQRIAEGLQAR